MSAILKVTCAAGHGRSTVAKFGTNGATGAPWPRVDAAGAPIPPRAFWTLQGASEAVVRERERQPHLTEGSHETLTLQCPRCPLRLQVHHLTLREILTPYADRGDTRAELADLIAAASPAST